MLKITKKDKRTELEKEIDKRLDTMVRTAQTPEQIKAVMELMDKRKQLDEKKTVSPDTMAVIAGNLLGILLILTYEKANVITTKALGFVLRGRV